MRKLPRPDDDAVAVFNVCIGRIRDADLKHRLQSCTEAISEASAEFDEKAAIAELHTIEAKESVANVVSVDEMKKVYTGRMAKKLSPGRVYYDKLMSLPEHGRCPLCSQRVVSTLDHHLPKTHYPSLAVSPLNLIPACQDCNKIKSQFVPLSSKQETLHPYYDNVESFSWIKARLTEVTPVTVEFYVEPPDDCDEVLIERLKRHFITFDLATLYSSHAAEELANIEFIAKKIFDDSGGVALREYLGDIANSRRRVSINSWQSAFYACLHESNWFCQNRFL